MAVRLKDIALELGVSTVTVSKVLRGNTDVGATTRARVLKRMKELNYQPNMLARGLASGKTYTVGLVVPDLVHPFFAEFAKFLSGELRKSRRGLLIASSEEDPEVEIQEIRTLLQRGVDVLILASCQASPRSLEEFAGHRTPVLLFDRNFPAVRANFVGNDDRQVGQVATRHLIEIGRRRIAHIGGLHSSPSMERVAGYREALSEAGLKVDESLILTRERVEEMGDVLGRAMMRELLGRKPRPDAVFCYNDLTAIGAIEAVLDAGLRVPDDVAILGCGNLRYAEYLRVPLSSIDHHTEELGRRAAALALDLAARPKTEAKSVLLPPRLVARESTLGRGARRS